MEDFGDWAENPNYFLNLDGSPSTQDVQGGNGSEEEDDEAAQLRRSPTLTPVPLELNVNGLRILTNFRHREIIERVTNSLQNSTNLLIECPTNSERRLATLYATLAYWHQLKQDENSGNSNTSTFSIPNKRAKRTQKIYYGVDDFDQAHEVIEQLRKLEGTDFLKDLNMTVLGSRENLCLKEAASQEFCSCHNSSNTSRREQTQFKFIERSPSHQSNLDHVNSIEDFKQNCAARNCCPYLESQNLHENADFIISPQQFILSPELRQHYNINLSNVILIFDDGYDLEKACFKEASITVSSKELLHAAQKLEDIANSLPSQNDIIINLIGSLNSFHLWLKMQSEDRDRVTCEQLRNLPFLQELEINEANHRSFNDNLQTLLKCSPNPSDFSLITKLKKLLNILNVLWGNDHSHKYLHLELTKCSNDKRDLALKITCINPTLIFQPLADHTQSVIIGSACLAPISTFQNGFGIPFEPPLEIDSHDVPSNQLVLAFCSVGPQPQKIELNLRIRPRKKPEVQKAVGDALLNICEQIPNGIVVIFQAQHTMLHLMQKKWKEVQNHLTPSIMENLTQVKDVFSVLDYSPTDLPTMLEQYQQSSRSPKGAILFAVARDKLHDHILRTFRGEEIRAIVHVGIPFGDWNTDNFLKAKDEISQDEGIPAALSEMKWWNNKEAFRIMNQSFPPCVQDPQDWKAVIVLDCRAEGNQEEFNQLIPAWTRSGKSKFRHCAKFSDLICILESWRLANCYDDDSE
ncbi:unnamed protein product [Orchesella dallaii]|uniref:Helicase ATP-binding domain-containing protein n=1 Tax=Orchesella dallaii TaxID=48710 RepID=A0ABP1PYD7_9HEXA